MRSAQAPRLIFSILTPSFEELTLTEMQWMLVGASTRLAAIAF